MTKPTADQTQALFRRLDFAFWMMWLVFPVIVWLAYLNASEPGAALEGAKSGAGSCAEMLPRPGQMSPAGKLVYWMLFAFQISIYVVLLTVLHRMVHGFANRRIFVSETLANVRFMGIVLIVWPFLELAVEYGAFYALKSFGDLPHIRGPNGLLDIGPLAVGVFLIALGYVLEQGMALKSENDLTI